MLLFSEYMRELMRERGLNIAELARMIGSERTLLSKVLTGTRVLPGNFLDPLIYYLRLTPAEEKQFLDYYEIQYERKGVRGSKRVIDKLFMDLACLNLTASAYEEKRLLTTLKDFAAGRSIFQGKMNVASLLGLVILEEENREDAALSLTVPFSESYSDSINFLHMYLYGSKKIEVTHILCFDPAGNEKDSNPFTLHCFSHVLPVCLLSREHYHPYYFYGDAGDSSFMNPYPYFMITHSCVVCLSEDGEGAMLLQSPEQIAYYRKYFNALMNKSYSLVSYTCDPLVILDSYQKCTESNGFYMIMDQPCFARFYTEDFVQSHLRHELPGYGDILNAAGERFALLKSVKNFYTIFTEAGLKRFMRDGTLDDYPVELVTPFEPEERSELMNQMAEAVRSGEVTGRVIPEGTFPDYLSMCTTAEHGVGFFTTANFPLADGLCSVWIRELNLNRAFHNWLIGLPKNDQTLSKEKTAEILERLAQQ